MSQEDIGLLCFKSVFWWFECHMDSVHCVYFIIIDVLRNLFLQVEMIQ